MSNQITVTVNGKDYVIARPPTAYHLLDRTLVVGVVYWSTRNGEAFGPIRAANNSGKGVGAKLVVAALSAYGLDGDTLLKVAK